MTTASGRAARASQGTSAVTSPVANRGHRPFRLTLLRQLGIDPDDEQMVETIDRVSSNCHWEHEGQRFFDGEVEPCINGLTVAIGAYFGVDVDGIVERLLGEQLEDGGWNCEAENGSVRSSFDTTLCVLEGLWEHERGTDGSAESAEARRRGEAYLLDRHLFSAAEHGRDRHTELSRVFVPDVVALRRAARARLLPFHRAGTGFAARRSDRASAIQMAA